MTLFGNDNVDRGIKREERSSIVIAGNMNVGKTTLFSKMCKKNRVDFNLPGNTVTAAKGHIRGTDKSALDTPGIFSIFSKSEDARISRDIFLLQEHGEKIEGVIIVADAKNMKRSIALTLQFAEYGLPMLLNINMIDEAASRGIAINFIRLGEILGIDVCPTVARDGIGVSKLISKINGMKVPKKLTEPPPRLKQFLEISSKLLAPADIPPKALAILLLVDDNAVEKYVKKKFGISVLEQLKFLSTEYQNEEHQPCNISFMNMYHNRAEEIVDEVQTVEPPTQNPLFLKFGDWCTGFSTGIPIALVILFFLYLFVGLFGATFLVDTINKTAFQGFLIPFITKLMESVPSPFIRDMMVDPDYGILPTGVFLALGLVTPVLLCFYMAFGLLEDSGYLPRISILLNKVFMKMGLNGKGVIPMLLGFSCVTMAILTTRMLDTEKEKNIATFLLILGMPCAPLLAVMLVILGNMPLSASITVFGLIFGQIFVAGFLADKILPGEKPRFLMEIPAMRVPKPLQIIKTSVSKTFFFMKEAVPVFILASLFIFLFERMGGLSVLEHISEPVIKNFMGLPAESVQVFIKTIIRRESGATEIERLAGTYDGVQIVVNLLVMTFLSPCMNATIVIFKERGSKIAIAIISTVMLYSAVIGSIVNHACRIFGITFT